MDKTFEIMYIIMQNSEKIDKHFKNLKRTKFLKSIQKCPALMKMVEMELNGK